jgi:hypothetical protein
MKCQTLMTRPRGLALLLILAVMPRAFAQNELNWTPAAGRESTGYAIPERELGDNKASSNLPSPNAHSPRNIVTSDASGSSTVPLSPWATDVVKLSDAGIENEVILAFIDNAGIFSLGADQILRLHESGVPSQLITAMIQHDAEVTAGIRPLTMTAEPSTHRPIQFVLVPVTKATGEESKPPKSSIDSVVPANGGATDNPPTAQDPDISFEPSGLENNAALPTGQTGSTARQQPIPAPKAKLYRVREPYPEPITAPILVFKAAGITANTWVIEFPQ